MCQLSWKGVEFRGSLAPFLSPPPLNKKNFWEPDGLHLKVKAKLGARRTFAHARFDAIHWLSNLPVFSLAEK